MIGAIHHLVDEIVTILVQSIPNFSHVRVNGGIIVITLCKPSESIAIRIEVRHQRIGECHIEFNAIIQTIIIGIVVEWIGQVYIEFVQIEQSIEIRIKALIVLVD